MYLGFEANCKGHHSFIHKIHHSAVIFILPVFSLPFRSTFIINPFIATSDSSQHKTPSLMSFVYVSEEQNVLSEHVLRGLKCHFFCAMDILSTIFQTYHSLIQPYFAPVHSKDLLFNSPYPRKA